MTNQTNSVIGSNLLNVVETFGLPVGEKVLEVDIREIDSSVFDSGLMKNKSYRFMVLVDNQIYKPSEQGVIGTGNWSFYGYTKNDCKKIYIEKLIFNAEKYNRLLNTIEKSKNAGNNFYINAEKELIILKKWFNECWAVKLK